MTPERWQRTEELYHAARAVAPGERRSFLTEQCPGDEALRRDVESLLNEVSGDGFLSKPALAVAPPDAAVAPASIIGRSLGAYRLQALLGAGGMGEVYQARDPKLERDVAIKVLPPAFTADPDRLSRLDREARMLGALNHPNICAIYGLEEADGIRFLILELVEGETLADVLRLKCSGSGLPLPEALAIARQITEAIETAHDKGIVHRDLKPANIKITPDGVVKVLDFGLAKAVGGGASSPDLTHAPAARRDGMLVGTAAYMSPEQARGLAVDKRTDVWAFGCVLYEMLTGRVAFAADTVSDTIAKVLEREPDWSVVPACTPISIRRLLVRCLSKDPRQRLRDIGDGRIEIDATDEILPGAAGPSAAAGARSAPLLWLMVIVLAIALAVAAAKTLAPPRPLAVTRFTHVLPPGQTLNGSRGAHIVAVSPDGAQLVYSGTPFGLYLRSMSEAEAKVIPGTERVEGTAPVFSPDGRSIVFFAIGDQALKKIAVAGGAAQTVCAVQVWPTGISWGPEGIVFGQGNGGIQRVSADGGVPEVLVEVEDAESAHGPQLLPGGTHVLFTLATGTAPSRWDKARIVVQSLKTRERKVLLEGGSDARYLPTGHIVYALGGSLYAAAFEIDTLEVKGERVPVVEGVRRAAGNFTGAAVFSVSNNGSLIYVEGPAASGGSGPVDLAVMTRTGEVQPLNLPPGPYAVPRVSPDGARIAFESDDGKEAIIYTYQLSGASVMQRLTSGGNNRSPIWASDSRVAFQSDREGDRAVWWQRLDGAAERLTTPEPGTVHTPESWFGETLLYSVTKGSDVSLWTFSLQVREPRPFRGVHSSTPTGATLSPDGRWLAYSTTERGKATLYVEAFPSTGVRYPLTAKVSDSPKHPRWSRNGTELFYNPNFGGLESVRVTTAPFAFGNAVAVPKRLYGGPLGSRTSYDISADGRLVGVVTAGHKEYVRGSDNRIEVVLNWHERLKAQLPGR